MIGKKGLEFFFNHKLHKIDNALPVVAKPLCKKMPYQSGNCVIHGYKFTDDYYDDDAFDFSHWDKMIEDENELNIFLIVPYPPPLIGPYDYCATPDEEYDLMIDKLRSPSSSHHGLTYLRLIWASYTSGSRNKV